MPLYPFQQAAVDWLLTKNRAVLGSELGTGKTYVTLSAAYLALRRYSEGLKLPARRDDSCRIFIVAPAFLRHVWEDEIKKWLHRPGSIQVVTKGTQTLTLARWTIFSYESFLAHSKNFNIVSAPYVAIFDEAHYLAHFSSQRTKKILGAHSIFRRSKYVWFLTGTPFPNNVCDSYNIFNFCLYGRFKLYWDFAERYAYIRTNQYARIATGIRRENIPELVNLVRPVFHRDTIAAHLSELPGYQEVKVPIALSDSKESNAKGLSVDGLSEDDEHRILLAIEDGDQSIENDEHISTARRLLGLLKISGTVDFVTDLLSNPENGPIVVFAHHTDVVEGIAKGLRDAGFLNTATITGSTPEYERRMLIQEFQNGHRDALVVSIRAGGLGITLTRSHIAVFAEVDWTPGALEQAMKRILRIGQKSFCLYYHLFAKDTLDEKVYRLLFSKVRAVKAFMDVWEKDKGNQLNAN